MTLPIKIPESYHESLKTCHVNYSPKTVHFLGSSLNTNYYCISLEVGRLDSPLRFTKGFFFLFAKLMEINLSFS